MKTDSGFNLFLEFTRSQALSVDRVSVELLKEYVARLLSWNQRINLVSRATSTDDIWISHILHSISPLFVVEIPDGSRLLDIGSGGGLPGIPMAIVRRDMDVTLIDSISKKTAALENMVHELGLPNVTVVTGRAEDQSFNPVLSSNFDVITARAVAPLADLIKWAIPFARHRDQSAEVTDEKPSAPFLLAMKGGDLTEEAEQARAKWKGYRITLVDTNFQGLEGAGLEDKKIFVVELARRK